MRMLPAGKIFTHAHYAMRNLCMTSRLCELISVIVTAPRRDHRVPALGERGLLVEDTG